MGRDNEYADFVTARWARFVKAGLLLGNTQTKAEDLAQTALVRCYVAWSKLRAATDRDAYAYRILLNCHRDSRRRHWWGEHATDDVPDSPTADPAAAAAMTGSTTLPATSRWVRVARGRPAGSARLLPAAVGPASGSTTQESWRRQRGPSSSTGS